MKAEALQALDEFISKQRKFKVEGYQGGMTLKEFIDNFHAGSLWNNPNIYTDNGERMPVKHNAMRSVVDTIIACQSHFDVTVEQVMQVFRDAYDARTLKGHYCPDIRRLVLRTSADNWQTPYAGSIDANLGGAVFSDFFYAKKV